MYHQPQTNRHLAGLMRYAASLAIFWFAMTAPSHAQVQSSFSCADGDRLAENLYKLVHIARESASHRNCLVTAFWQVADVFHTCAKVKSVVRVLESAKLTKVTSTCIPTSDPGFQFGQVSGKAGDVSFQNLPVQIDASAGVTVTGKHQATPAQVKIGDVAYVPRIAQGDWSASTGQPSIRLSKEALEKLKKDYGAKNTSAFLRDLDKAVAEGVPMETRKQ